jgi:hypothetical protein
MGQRGPAPEPVALKVLKGETRPSQLGKAPEPLDPPKKPASLSAEAGEVWDRILSVTDHIGERYAETFRQYCEATAAVNIWQPKGTKEWRELVNVHRQLARELCLTPATGAALAKPKAPESKLSKYLAG